MARNVAPEVAAAHPLAVVKAHSGARRRNMVLVRCGGRSTHRRLYPLHEARNWDCVLSCYEPPQPQDLAQADCVITGGVSKWDAFSQARFEHPALGFDAYEHFFLVDDDVEFRVGADIDRLFDIAREHKLAICQPSLSPQSYAAWAVTRRHDSWFLRYTNFVECMVPLFDAQAVRLLEQDIRAAVSGCGLDLIFHSVLGGERRLAVIDAVSVTHTQPIDPRDGPFYRYLRSIGVDHQEEIAWFLARHGMANFAVATLGGMPIVQHIYPPQAA
jgi:hypothetical protein